MRDKGLVSSIGASVAAILASACCWLPLLLLALGAGAAAASLVGVLESLRPVTVPAALLLLGVAGWFTYVDRSSKDCCAPVGERARGSRLKRLNRYLLPLIAVLVLGLALFPSRVLSFLRPATETDLRAEANETVIVLSVPGMT